MEAADRVRLAADEWFGALPLSRQEALLALATVRTLPPGGRVYAVGDEPNGLWAVLEGQVRLVGYPVAGSELLTLLLTSGTWFGELSTLDGGRRPHDAIAFGRTRVLNVSRSRFERLAADDPALYRDVGLLVCAHQRLALDFISEALSLSIPQRVARTLLTQRRANGGPILRVRQDELAAITGIARQTLNRTLAKLAREGAIRLGYARIEVLDTLALERVVAS